MTKAGPADVATDWGLITAQLPADWREQAEKTGLLDERPERIGAKVDDIEPILRLFLYQAGASDSLRATVARAAALGLLSISHVALHKWMKKLGAYLVALLSRMVARASFAEGRSPKGLRASAPPRCTGCLGREQLPNRCRPMDRAWLAPESAMWALRLRISPGSVFLGAGVNRSVWTFEPQADAR